MPIYEYECPACGSRFEEIQKVSAPPTTHCPLCGRGGVRRLISQTSFQLKGTGWYATDYAPRKAGADGKDEKAKDKKEAKSAKKEGDAAAS
jgi:putative FmdB family regulatory protein